MKESTKCVLFNLTMTIIYMAILAVLLFDLLVWRPG